MFWIALALAAGSFIVSLMALYVILVVLRSTRRAERSGDERLEILREQQQRLQFLREERRVLEDQQARETPPHRICSAHSLYRY